MDCAPGLPPGGTGPRSEKSVYRRRVRVSRRTKIIAGSVAGVVVVGGAVAALTVFREQIGSRIPVIGDIFKVDECSLSGAEPEDSDVASRPAVAVKVENAQVAYPLSGLDDAELVYEELVEGGVTRFMAMYHCRDSKKVGPVRSARAVDPGIMIPVTKILAYSGQNAPVLDALQKAGIVRIDESNAKGAMSRVPREGLTDEHTLYVDTAEVRERAIDKFDEVPPEDVFKFGDIDGDTKRGKTIEIKFSDLTQIRYVFTGDGYERFQPTEQPFVLEGAGQLSVENVLIEEHEVNNSKKIRDVQGNPSTEIADTTGSGTATLFRDGQAIEGRWKRQSLDDLVRFETKSGDEMVFAPGAVWIHLLPNQKGELRGSFEFR
jgi:Protein of unknown function (DUF3048) N-terminal domain/Protein of unknown function (DUF3048) C-terminal domain